MPALTVSYSGFVNNDNASSLLGALSVTTAATAQSAVGTYAITPGGQSSPNYVITYVPGMFTVTQAALTVTANNHTKSYGSPVPPLTVSYSGFVNNDSEASLGGSLVLATTATSSSAVGAYAITASGHSSPNYLITYVPGTLTVTQAALMVTANDQTKVYGAALPTLSVAYTGFVNGDTPGVLDGSLSITTTATSASSVGTYVITAGGQTSPNYTITYVPGKLTVAQAALTVTAKNQTKLYGAELPALTVSYAGFVNGDGEHSLSGTLVVGTTATAASAVGSYPITVGGKASSNYTITYVPGTLTVAQAALTVTANDQTKAYGAGLPTLSVSYAGFVNGDTPAVLGGSLSVTTTAKSASPVGIYAITAGGQTSANYTITYVPGKLTIAQAALTITAANQTKLYGVALPPLIVSYAGFVNGDGEHSLNGTLVIATPATPTSSVGTYAITAGGQTSPNYTITYVPGMLTITKSPTTLTYIGSRTSDFHDATEVAATLVHAPTGLPVIGALVAMSLNGVDTCSAPTDTSGNARCSLTPSQMSGSYSVSASFSGDGNRFGSTVSSPFVVTQEQTVATYEGASGALLNGSTVMLKGSLKEDGTTPIAGRTLTLTLGTGAGAQTCLAVTDATGAAGCSVTVSQPLGPGTVTADFAGDGYYVASSSAQSTLVYAFPSAGGAFTIGDNNAAVGSTVSFWGGQWSKLNSLSGGAAPPAFKGFAKNPLVPSCGATWNTGPGNSVDPPASPLPAYMGVIVTSSVSTSGSSISGNTARLVVLRTGAGYDSDPGHIGTGTVIATANCR